MTARSRLRERRARHRSRPLLVRALVALGGFATLLGGVAMLVLPGPGIPLIIVGLGLLALEFAWAEAALARVLVHAERMRPTSAGQKVAGGLALLATTTLAAVVLVVWGIPGF